MSTQHTPGPWKMGCNSTYELAIIGPKNQVVVDAAWLGGSACKLRIDNEADARLITAAPENYACNKELAKIVRELCAKYKHPLPAASLGRSDDAIAKASYCLADAMIKAREGGAA